MKYFIVFIITLVLTISSQANTDYCANESAWFKKQYSVTKHSTDSKILITGNLNPLVYTVLTVGGAISGSDGRHTRATYKLIEFNNNSYTIEVRKRYNLKSFGGEKGECKNTFTLNYDSV